MSAWHPISEPPPRAGLYCVMALIDDIPTQHFTRWKDRWLGGPEWFISALTHWHEYPKFPNEEPTAPPTPIAETVYPEFRFCTADHAKEQGCTERITGWLALRQKANRDALTGTCADLAKDHTPYCIVRADNVAAVFRPTRLMTP